MNIRKIIIFITSMLVSFGVFAQSLVTIDLGDDVYNFLRIAEQKGYCKRLSSERPYTESYILDVLDDIEDSIDSLDDSYIKEYEKKTVNYYQGRFSHKEGFDLNSMKYTFTNDSSFPVTFEVSDEIESFVSSGVYNDSSLNSTGFELFNQFNIAGQFTDSASYRISPFIGLTKMDLQQVGDDYLIGYWWYDDWKHPVDEVNGPVKRTINTYRNNNVLPYSYKKKWDGSIYYLTNVTASGLEGWPFVPSFGFGMYGEVRASFLDDAINLGIGRINREWAGMDNYSSLVFNENASPFFSMDMKFKLFDWLSFSTLTGVLEFPNCEFINENAWNLNDPAYDITVDSNVVDSYYFQNAFSIAQFDFDFKYIHADFGSTCVWPKRFELGYLFPIINQVIYQNSVGDFDNLALYGDLKAELPGYGSAWFSVFLDEINSFSPKFWLKTRCMYAWQTGLKANIPWLPFTTLSMRYSKVEPYCYTHQAITKQPWYDYYISEAYMNNGKGIGYYLEPNSDELFIRLESIPVPAANFSLQYQLVRHGADYGSGAVAGSSIWSELPIGNRDIYYKHFLHDGAYEWTHIIQLGASYNFNQLKLPFQLNGSLGYVYDSYTLSDGGPTDKNGHPYQKINTSEYPVKQGVVFNIGIKLFDFDHFK